MALSLHEFARLMLAQLAANSKAIGRNGKTIYDSYLPFSYRERIENILCADNGWKERFSPLIDVKMYFDDHFWWEDCLAREILKVVREQDKTLEYDLVFERIHVPYDYSEIEAIWHEFDVPTLDLMNHFANLIDAPIYSRRHKEEICDYSAKSTAKMRQLYEMRSKSGTGIVN